MFTSIDRIVTGAMSAACLLAASLAGRAQAGETGPRPAGEILRVLILSGQGDHDWRTSTSCLRRLLAGTGRFDVRICEAPSGLTAQTLSDFDVLVDDAGEPASGSDVEKEPAIARFVESGKGLVVTHGALTSWAHAARRRQDAGPAGLGRRGPGSLERGTWADSLPGCEYRAAGAPDRAAACRAGSGLPTLSITELRSSRARK